MNILKKSIDPNSFSCLIAIEGSLVNKLSTDVFREVLLFLKEKKKETKFYNYIKEQI